MNNGWRPLAALTEAELVERAQNRDEAAFEELMFRNSSVSFRLALSVLKDRQEAEDELQNAFIKAWKRLGTFRLESRFSTWFRSIVMNQSLMRLRMLRRAGTCPLENQYDNQYAAPDPCVEKEYGRNQLSHRLRAETKAMPPLLREVLILRDLEDRSIEEIAGLLGISAAAVKSRLARARPMLRQRMERHIA